MEVSSTILNNFSKLFWPVSRALRRPVHRSDVRVKLWSAEDWRSRRGDRDNLSWDTLLIGVQCEKELQESWNRFWNMLEQHFQHTLLFKLFEHRKTLKEMRSWTMKFWMSAQAAQAERMFLWPWHNYTCTRCWDMLSTCLEFQLAMLLSWAARYLEEKQAEREELPGRKLQLQVDAIWHNLHNNILRLL